MKETARVVGEVLPRGCSQSQVRRVFQEEWNGQQYGQCMSSDQQSAWSMSSAQSPVAVNVLIMMSMMEVAMMMSLFLCAASLCLKHLFFFLHLYPNCYGSHFVGSPPLAH